jgi:hypothetical protein
MVKYLGYYITLSIMFIFAFVLLMYVYKTWKMDHANYGMTYAEARSNGSRVYRLMLSSDFTLPNLLAIRKYELDGVQFSKMISNGTVVFMFGKMYKIKLNNATYSNAFFDIIDDEINLQDRLSDCVMYVYF